MSRTTLICLPEEGIQVEQAMLITTKWLRSHPEQLHQGGRESVFIALAQAFPCAK